MRELGSAAAAETSNTLMLASWSVPVHRKGV